MRFLLILSTFIFLISCKSKKVSLENIKPDHLKHKEGQFTNIYKLYENVPFIKNKFKKVGITKGRKSSKDMNFVFDDNQVLVLDKPKYLQYTFIIKRRDGFNGFLENYNIRYDKKSKAVTEFISKYPLYQKDKKMLLNLEKASIQIIKGIPTIDSADTNGLSPKIFPVKICRAKPCNEEGKTEKELILSRQAIIDKCIEKNIKVYQLSGKDNEVATQLFYSRESFSKLLEAPRKFINSLPEQKKNCYLRMDELRLGN